MGAKRSYLKSAAQLLGVVAMGWAFRKATKVPPARIQSLMNRLALSWNFFRATSVNGTIHRAEFDFIYLDGDRSAHTKQVAGLWPHDADSPDVLYAVPKVWQLDRQLWPPYDAAERRAMILARADRRRDAVARTHAQIVEALRCERRLGAKEDGTKAGVPGNGLPGWQVRAVGAYMRAFASYPVWPAIPPLSSLPSAEN